jgi:hypothetical protein
VTSVVEGTAFPLSSSVHFGPVRVSGDEPLPIEGPPGRVGITVYNYGPHEVEVVGESGVVIGSVPPDQGGFITAPFDWGKLVVRPVREL